MPLASADERHLSRAIELAWHAREKGNHPFGAVLVDARGDVVLEAENTVMTEMDCTNHAELNLVRAAGSRLNTSSLNGCTLYASTEPCAMCAGAIYWSGIGRVVFSLSTVALTAIVDGDDGTSMLAVSSRDVLDRGGRGVDVSGPHLEEQGRAVHEGFWAELLR
jgi:tRNA(Arg) A34 adenosine deaminase TadA